jgi:hypothetical protein
MHFPQVADRLTQISNNEFSTMVLVVLTEVCGRHPINKWSELIDHCTMDEIKLYSTIHGVNYNKVGSSNFSKVLRKVLCFDQPKQARSIKAICLFNVESLSSK